MLWTVVRRSTSTNTDDERKNYPPAKNTRYKLWHWSNTINTFPHLLGYVDVDIGGGWQYGSWHSHWSICTQIGYPLACVVRYIILCCIAPSFAFWSVKTSKYKENTHNMCTYCLTRTVFSGAVPRIEIAISRTGSEKQDEVPEETKRYQLPRHDCNSTGKA